MFWGVACNKPIRIACHLTFKRCINRTLIFNFFLHVLQNVLMNTFNLAYLNTCVSGSTANCQYIMQIMNLIDYFFTVYCFGVSLNSIITWKYQLYSMHINEIIHQKLFCVYKYCFMKHHRFKTILK